jgi:hypothetical protein
MESFTGPKAFCLTTTASCSKRDTWRLLYWYGIQELNYVLHNCLIAQTLTGISSEPCGFPSITDCHCAMFSQYSSREKGLYRRVFDSLYIKSMDDLDWLGTTRLTPLNPNDLRS